MAPKKGEDWQSWPVESKMETQVFKGEFQAGEQKDVKVPFLYTEGKPRVYPTAVTVTGKNLDVNGVKMDLTYYFVENVGMIKQEINMVGKKIVIELEKFQPPTKKKKDEE